MADDYVNMSLVQVAASPLLVHVWSLSEQRSLFNTFRIRFRLGLFDPVEDQPYTKLGADDMGDAGAHASNLAAARQSLVLLENNQQTLPLSKTTSIAVIGPNANASFALAGNYASSSILCPNKTLGCYPSVFQVLTCFLHFFVCLPLLYL